MLTETQIAAFRDRGFLAVRGVLTAEALDALRAAADRLVERARGLTESDTIFELERDHVADNPRLCRVSHPVAEDPVFWETAVSDAVLDCVEALVGSDIRFHHSKLNMKVGRGGAEIGWHQDEAFFPHTNRDLVACGIALDDSTRENGCLFAVPGTHRIGVLDHRDTDGQFLGKIMGGQDRFDPEAAEAIELRAGDMSIHHVGVIHGSAANESASPRRLFICQYAACDAVPLDYRPPVNAFAGRVVRGRPATHARLEQARRVPLRGDTTESRSIFERQRM